jgi:integrase
MTVLPIRKGPDEAGAAKVVPANQKAIDTLPFASGMWRVEGIPGLYVRCRAKTKSFRLERRIDGVLLKKTLAAETVKQAKAAALTEWTRMKPRPAPAGVTTLHMAVEQYLGGKVPELAPKTVEIARYNLDRHLSRWKDRSLAEIGGDRAGIRTLQQVVTKKHGRSTSNQVIRLLAAVYRWHQDIDQDLPDWPRKAAAIHKIKSRQWAYAPDELRAWWYATRKEKDGAVTELGVKTLAPIKRMWWLTALFTGARKGSIEALRWSDVDPDKKVIRFRVTKGDRPYAVPISDTLAELLACYRESEAVPPSEWVFPSPIIDGAHIVNVKNPNEGVRAPHKLRHTFRTVLAELGASTDQARLLMGHSLGGDVSLGYITSGLVVESLRPLANAVARHYVAVIGELS